MSTPNPAMARRILSLLDLTSLNDTDDAAAVRKLCALAVSAAGRVAAVCIWPRFIPVARSALLGTGVPVAVVANFPAGSDDIGSVAAETAADVADGADEVDVVFPYRAFLAGDVDTGVALVRRCREACGSRVVLKVILETGQLGLAENIRRAADMAVAGGAQFLKTSTGKTQPGATPQAVAVLLDVIAEARARGRSVGLKVSGGIRTVAEASALLQQYELRFGPQSATPATFRIGASTLVTELLAWTA
jgi:deoxyribose-phosphate aldolase